MGQLIVGSVVSMPFPFSDLSAIKRRPVVALADAGHGDRVFSQVTSNAYADADAVTLTQHEFASGGLQLVSYVRPAKLFTGNQKSVLRILGQLRPEVTKLVVTGVIRLLIDGK